MSKSAVKVLIAAAVGLAAGIGVGILIAPARGSKTRKRLKKHFMELTDQVQEEISDKLNSIRSAFGSDEEMPEETPASQKTDKEEK